MRPPMFFLTIIRPEVSGKVHVIIKNMKVDVAVWRYGLQAILNWPWPCQVFRLHILVLVTLLILYTKKYSGRFRITIHGKRSVQHPCENEQPIDH